MIIFTLAECPQCHARYAVAPDPRFPGQWIFFGRDTKDFEHPTHMCAGGLLCLQGHELRVTAQEAVLTSEGDWLRLDLERVPAVLN